MIYVHAFTFQLGEQPFFVRDSPVEVSREADLSHCRSFALSRSRISRLDRFGAPLQKLTGHLLVHLVGVIQ